MIKRTIGVATVVVCAGCTPTDVTFGETHRWNIEQHVINPDPQYADEASSETSGRRAAAAVERLETGRVKQPVSGTTTSSAIGSSPGASSDASSSSGSSTPTPQQ
jgi:hypothetical protein